jgi:hypothetical protein
MQIHQAGRFSLKIDYMYLFILFHSPQKPHPHLTPLIPLVLRKKHSPRSTEVITYWRPRALLTSTIAATYPLMSPSHRNVQIPSLTVSSPNKTHGLHSRPQRHSHDRCFRLFTECIYHSPPELVYMPHLTWVPVTMISEAEVGGVCDVCGGRGGEVDGR